MKKRWKILGILLCAILLAVIGLIAFLSATEFKPADREAAAVCVSQGTAPDPAQTFTIWSWNTGYGGLGRDSDFFMDGGKMVDPPSQEIVTTNLDSIRNYLLAQEADAWLLQEVDIDSARTGGTDQFSLYADALAGSSAFAYNYKCPFVPIPMPPMGRVESGITTLTPHSIAENAERISLPCPFSWPVRTAQIKRCLLTTRLPLDGTDKELVLVNLHLEAYDSGEGKIAQFKELLTVLQEEYDKGNYVIAGGDFNQSFPGVLEQYPIADPELWTPGILEADALPEGWQYAYDLTSPTCRLLDKPYDGSNQLYVIDGFIVSPNVEIEAVETADLEFEHSDHNPVRLEVKLVQ